MKRSTHAIGFTNKYYTLWNITKEPTKNGIRVKSDYLQNLSFDESEAKNKFEDIVGVEAPNVDETLKGVNKSFETELINEEFFPKGKYKYSKISNCSDIDYLYWAHNNLFKPKNRKYSAPILKENGYIEDGNFFKKPLTREEKLLENCDKGLFFNKKEKVEVEVEVLNVFSFEDYYGTKDVIEMVSSDNKLLKYVGSNPPFDLSLGFKGKIRGTVKYDDYRGETKLQRIKVLNS